MKQKFYRAKHQALFCKWYHVRHLSNTSENKCDQCKCLDECVEIRKDTIRIEHTCRYTIMSAIQHQYTNQRNFISHPRTTQEPPLWFLDVV